MVINPKSPMKNLASMFLTRRDVYRNDLEDIKRMAQYILDSVEMVEMISPEKIYQNTAYDEPFIVLTDEGEMHTVTLEWDQGWGEGYTFRVVDSDRYFLPNDILKVEAK